jgi:cytochrome oxidase assembly protein ShyY1
VRFASGHRVPTSPQPAVTELNTIDVGRIQAQLARPLAGDYVELEEPAPTAADGLPVLPPLPELSNGPHLSYTVQWFIFTVCAGVGWVLVVRKSARAQLNPPPSAPATAEPT